MKNLSKLLTVAALCAALSPLAHADASQDAHDFKDDVKSAGKQTGHAIKRGAKATGHVIASGARAVGHGARDVGHGIANGTRNGYEDAKHEMQK